MIYNQILTWTAFAILAMFYNDECFWQFYIGFQGETMWIMILVMMSYDENDVDYETVQDGK